MISRITRRRGAAALGIGAAILAATLAACGGGQSGSPSSTTPTTSASSSAPAPSPTEKGIVESGGNSFSPQVKAPPAPTGVPGTNHIG